MLTLSAGRPAVADEDDKTTRHAGPGAGQGTEVRPGHRRHEKGDPAGSQERPVPGDCSATSN